MVEPKKQGRNDQRDVTRRCDRKPVFSNQLSLCDKKYLTKSISTLTDKQECIPVGCVP